MKRVCLCLFAVFAGMAGPVWAGAWQREEGVVFVAGNSIFRDGRAAHEYSVFAEYGWRQNLTIGLDINSRDDGVGHGVLFARMPLARLGENGRVAVQVGAGWHQFSGQTDTMARIGLLYGRSLGENGWLGLEPAVEFRAGLGPALYKFDAVVGLPSSGRVQPMVKLETIYKDGYGFGWTATPSLIVQGKRGTRWIFGLEYKQGGGTQSVGVAVGIWQRF